MTNSSETKDHLDELLTAGAQPGSSLPEDAIDMADLAAYARGELDDPKASEIEKVLAESKYHRELLFELAKPVSDILQQRMVNEAQKTAKKPRRWASLFALSGAGIAAAAALMMTFSAPPHQPGAYNMQHLNAVQLTRGKETVSAQGPARYVPQTKVKIKITPTGIFVADNIRIYLDREGELVEAGANFSIRSNHGNFMLEGKAKEVFGESAYRGTLWVAAATDQKALDSLGKKMPLSIIKTENESIRWAATPIDYQTP